MLGALLLAEGVVWASLTVDLIVLNEGRAHTCLLMDQLAWAPWHVAFVDWTCLAIYELALVHGACLGVCVVP